MKRLLLYLMAGGAVSAADTRIVNYTLDQGKVFTVKTSPNVVTTVVFPEVIEMVDAKGFVMDASKQAGKFELGYAPGTNYFSVMPLASGNTMNVNVGVDGNIYALELVTSDQPAFKVSFGSEGTATSTVIPGGAIQDGGVLPPLAENSASIDLEDKRKISVARVLGLIDKSRAYPLLAQQNDGQVKDLLVAFPEKVYDLGTVTATLRGVFRDNSFDGICFWVDLVSKDGRQHYYDTENFRVEVGNRSFQSFTAAASGVIPESGTASAFFAIAGDGQEGGRNDLAPSNDFRIKLTLTSGERRVEPLLPGPTPEPEAPKAIHSSK
jgi:hypothetical protein